MHVALVEMNSEGAAAHATKVFIDVGQLKVYLERTFILVSRTDCFAGAIEKVSTLSNFYRISDDTEHVYNCSYCINVDGCFYLEAQGAE